MLNYQYPIEYQLTYLKNSEAKISFSAITISYYVSIIFQKRSKATWNDRRQALSKQIANHLFHPSHPISLLPTIAFQETAKIKGCRITPVSVDKRRSRLTISNNSPSSFFPSRITTPCRGCSMPARASSRNTFLLSSCKIVIFIFSKRLIFETKISLDHSTFLHRSMFFSWKSPQSLSARKQVHKPPLMGHFPVHFPIKMIRLVAFYWSPGKHAHFSLLFSHPVPSLVSGYHNQ